MDISILLATYKRKEFLERTLVSLTKMDTRGISWEVLVADNGDDPDTKAIVESFRKQMDIHYFVEKERGRNKALNSIIPKARGKVCVLTDDDIVADKGWLKEIWEGLRRWPEHSIFGGRILPFNPEIIPDVYKRFDSYPHLYAVADWDMPEGTYDPIKVFGPNMIVRSDIFSCGYRFCESMGISLGSYMAGSESEFLLRLHEEGYKSVYLPKALVYHYIRDEQVTSQWVLERGFQQGRTVAYLNKDQKVPRILGIPRYLYRAYAEHIVKSFLDLISRDPVRIKSNIYVFKVFHGQFYQYWKINKKAGH